MKPLIAPYLVTAFAGRLTLSANFTISAPFKKGPYFAFQSSTEP